MADIQNFINQYVGQNNVGDTDPNRGQCVGLVEVWLDANGWPHIWGNACDLPANADRGAYDIVPNTPDYVPPVGAVGCLPAGWGGSPVGHTFIVAPGTTQQTLVVFEQNDRIGGGDGSCRIFDGIGWPDGLTFIAPKDLEAPAPEPAPAPDPQPAPVEAPTPVEAPAPVDPTPAPEVAPEVAPATPGPVAPTTPDPAPVSAPIDSPQTDPTVPSETPVPVNNIKETKMTHPFLSRKFIITALFILGAVVSTIAGAVSAGESVFSITVISALYIAVQGAIDHADTVNK